MHGQLCLSLQVSDIIFLSESFLTFVDVPMISWFFPSIALITLYCNTCLIICFPRVWQYWKFYEGQGQHLPTWYSISYVWHIAGARVLFVFSFFVFGGSGGILTHYQLLNWMKLKEAELYRSIGISSTPALTLYSLQTEFYQNIRQCLSLAFKVKYTVVKERIK